MKISVTQQHIEKGERAVMERCPVALAIKAALGTRVRRVSVGTKHVIIRMSDNQSHILALPPYMESYITHYDREQGIEPVEFDLSIP